MRSHVAGRADVNGWGAVGRAVTVGLAGDGICQAARVVWCCSVGVAVVFCLCFFCFR